MLSAKKPEQIDPVHRDPYLELLKLCLTAAIYPESSWQIVTGLRVGRQTPLTKLRRRIITLLGRKNLMLVRRRRYEPSVRAAGDDWPCFGYSMAGLARMENVQSCIERVLADGVPGDLIETGVWRGGMVIFMRGMLNYRGDHERIVWAADSFAGLPPPRDPHDRQLPSFDLSEWDTLRVSLEEVRRNFERFGLLDDRVHFLPGWFAETLPAAPITRLALLRLDGDMYESTMDSLVPLYPKVSPGGFVIVDDYNSWPGCRQAVDDYRRRSGITEPLLPIDRQAVYWRKA